MQFFQWGASLARLTVDSVGGGITFVAERELWIWNANKKSNDFDKL